ncbi:flagellar biosynthesis protein FliQ [Aeromonas diversa]|uniref:Flagellar biosynthetic protein FliQ n=1 Tax=Aeromonas diversa CDC 2478-85 TaxID=1268237 RepID=N9VIH3_9GAMM|nr:flagellar biosynthesis protein FliQ [Aeromonas diversa]ENY71428.1 lateral flagellar biosynthetic protein, LfiQ [Aeromonas diversa CDC 2478-85]
MSPEQSVSLIGGAINLVTVMVCVLVVPGLLVGLVVSVFQAVTQIQEQTLSFLPRFVVTLLTLVFTGNWLVAKMMALFHDIFQNVPGMIG